MHVHTLQPQNSGFIIHFTARRDILFSINSELFPTQFSQLFTCMIESNIETDISQRSKLIKVQLTSHIILNAKQTCNSLHFPLFYSIQMRLTSLSILGYLNTKFQFFETSLVQVNLGLMLFFSFTMYFLFLKQTNQA